jgi:outer membrane protein
MTGTSVVVALSGSRQSTTSLNTLFNPQVPTGLTLGFNQKLLNGFGYRANAKFLRIAKTDLNLADSTFKQQVITTVTNVLNLYYTLLSDRENVRVAEHALAYAQKLLSDNKRQVEIGTLAPIEVVRAESEVAADEQNLIVAQTNYLQEQELLKTAISKQVGPQLAGVQIDATGQLPTPSPADIPPLEQALKEAEANRPEVRQAGLNIRNQEITIQAARNALLPTFDIFGTYAPTGLSGNSLVCPPSTALAGNVCQPGTVTPALATGGLSNALGQVFRGHYPDYSFGATLQIPLRNRAARADMATALLQVRQLNVQLQQAKNQVDQDVRNAEIAVTQAKARIAAAVKATTLARETLDAEQKKFQLGESTVFLVIQAERDLVTAQGNEVQARANYAKALTQFGQATGTTLARNNIELSEALSGQVNRNPNIPGTPVTPSPNPNPGNRFHRW